MFGIGIQELMIILVVALLVVGPTKLPGLARSLGKGLQELRKASDDLRTAIMIDDDEPSRRRTAPSRNIEAPPPSDEAAAGITGSLAAGPVSAGGAGGDDVELAPASHEGIVSRGEQGGDPHKRARDPEPPASGGAEGFVPSDPEVQSMLDEARQSAPPASAQAQGGAASTADGADAERKGAEKGAIT